MEDKLARFYKFIVRNIVKSVDYNPNNEELTINRIALSDEILSRIQEEGARYGLSLDDATNLVSQIASNVEIKPSLNIYKGAFDVKDIKCGQHFEIRFINPEKGENFVELLGIDKYRYAVLKSSISGLELFDVLCPISLLWNPGFFIDFSVYRNGRPYPDINTKLRIGKYTQTILYAPSVIYEIMDSDDNFSFKEKDSTPLNPTATIRKKEKKAYVWIPILMHPIAFAFDYNTFIDKKATFIITYSDDSTNATISLNKDFMLPEDKTQRDYLLQVISECCHCRNTMSSTDSLKYIRTVKKGILQKDVKEKSGQHWILVSKPQIKYIFE